MHKLSFFSISLILILIYGCKTSKITTTVAPTEDSLVAIVEKINEPDTIYLITEKGDTLSSLDVEVSIPIYRVIPDTITIAAVGDIMMGTDFPKSSYLPRENGEYLWKDSKSYLQKADITFGNLEGTVLDGEGTPKHCNNPDACYLFRMPPRLVQNLKDCGFDLLSLANNHANDFGKIGRNRTQEVLDSLDLKFAGAIERPYILTKINGIKIGFVAFAPNAGTLTFYDEAKAVSIINHLDSLSDMVIVSIHGGAEGAKNMHVTRKKEFYYGENRGNIYAFSHKMIDHGADLILAHGPHIPRAMEVYNKKLIAYSLGNFCTYGRFNLRGPNAEAPLLMAKVAINGNFLGGEIIPFKQSKADGPLYDPSKKSIRTIAELSRIDFPENEISIDENGKIIYIQN